METRAMSLTKMIKSGGCAALAILLASTSLSADAFAEGGRHNGGAQANGQEKGGGNWRGGGVTFPRSEALPRGGGRGASHENRGSWSRNNGAAPDTMRRGGWGDNARENRGGRTPAIAQNPGWRGSDRGARDIHRDGQRSHGDVTTRHRTVERDTPRYSDPDRNRTYSGRDRDNRSDTWRRDRDGDRRWSGHGDNWRSRSNDRDRDDWRSRDRDHNWRDRDRNWSRDGYRNSRDHNHRRWSNDWRRDRRYDWYTYRNQYGSIYRPGRYYSPYRHHHYNRLSIGIFLDSGFYGRNYWISNPSYYRLPPAYGPYRWVRYYDDVLLVDMYSGEVVDVIYDFFW